MVSLAASAKSEARLEVLRAFERSEKAPSFNPPLIDRKPDYTGCA